MLQQTVRVEMEELIRRREERTESEEREGRYRQVEKLYERLRSESPRSALPTFPVFRELGIMSVVLNNRKKTAAVVKEEMASPVFRSLLEDNLSVWRENQQRTLLKLLGRPNYRHGSSTKTHPLDLYSARFNCKKCKDQALKHFKRVSLSFADVCKHECVGLSCKPKDSSGKWSINQFELDKKAINAAKAFFDMAKVKEDNKCVGDIPAQAKVLCESCDGMVAMNSLDDVFEHGQRHENMAFSLLPGSTQPFLESGLRDELLGFARSATKKRKTKCFGCRHCLSRENINPSQGMRKEDQGKTEKKPSRLFDFDGIRSHLKSRHGVEYVADEDFFRILDDQSVALGEET